MPTGFRTPGGVCAPSAVEAQAAACAANNFDLGQDRFECITQSISATGYEVLQSRDIFGDGEYQLLGRQQLSPPISACELGGSTPGVFATMAEAAVDPVGALQLVLVACCVFALLHGYRSGDRV